MIHFKAIKKVHQYFNYKLELSPKAPNEDIIISRLKTSPFKEWVSH